MKLCELCVSVLKISVLKIIALFFAFPLVLFAQSNYRSPVDFSIGLSGTFGEPRTGHFHTGIDIRTQQAVGKKVYAIADGYVSRISVSPGGYGKALYITHFDGNTSVYGHLQCFNETITKYVTAEQYKNETFAINLILEPSQIPVKRGEVVALSGNSGSSAGPHLHFEIRDTETEDPLHPQAFGFKIEDKIHPVLKELRIIPKSPETTIKNSENPLNITLTGSGSKYKLTGGDTIRIAGKVSFAILATDQSTGSTSGNGVYSIALSIDKKVVFRQKMDRLNFNNSRCAISAIDYAEFLATKKRFQTTEIQPGNTAQIYEVGEERGIYTFDSQRVYEVKYEVGDFAGNKTTLLFYVEGVEPLPDTSEEDVNGYAIAWDERFDYAGEGIRFYGNAGVFFDNIIFRHSIEKQRPASALSPVHVVGDPKIPMKTTATLIIKPDEEALQKYDSSKLMVVSIDSKGGFSPQESVFQNGTIVAQVREMGRFTIAADITPPVITPVNISDGKKITAQKDIQVKIADNLSGINTYIGKLNGKWILMDYDRKNRLLTYTFDDRLQKGDNIFSLEVIDYAGNRSEIMMKLVY
ncbi:MAG: M23 family metallopeptidase [Bacteroidales bacterium]|nr:M23 family metallopeptidase [Bacteroidales bacterium]